MQSFGEKLRILRQRRSMTIRMVADELRYSHGFVHKLETGMRKCNVEHAIKLADLFDVSLDVLLRDGRELDAGEDEEPGMPGIQRFGEKLRTLRKQHGMTLQEVAHALGYVATGYISEIEFGKKRPGVEFILKVSRYFNVSMDVLTRDELDLE